MRILHTSDWHLGRTFGAVSLVDDQQAFLDWLVALCRDERIDLVVVAGDVYDRAVPPTDAVVMFRDALRRLQSAGQRVAVITGNHDGADRVAAYDDLADRSGVYIRGGYARLDEVLHLEFDDGPLDLALVPYLDPQAAPDHMPGAEHGPDGDVAAGARDLLELLELIETPELFARRVRRTHQSVLEAAIAAKAARRRAPRSLAVAHAFVAGGKPSESERDLSVGGNASVAPALFRGYSYTALGHLHRPQKVGARIRYSGTPLAYSFSETHDKSVTVVDMASDGTIDLQQVHIPVGRPVRTITGTLDDLLAVRAGSADTRALVRAVLTDRGPVLDAKQRLAAVYPHVVEIVLEPPVAEGRGSSGLVVDRRVVSAAEAADAFWKESIGEAPTAAQRDLLHRAIEHAQRQVA